MLYEQVLASFEGQYKGRNNFVSVQFLTHGSSIVIHFHEGFEGVANPHFSLPIPGKLNFLTNHLKPTHSFVSDCSACRALFTCTQAAALALLAGMKNMGKGFMICNFS